MSQTMSSLYALTFWDNAGVTELRRHTTRQASKLAREWTAGVTLTSALHHMTDCLLPTLLISSTWQGWPGWVCPLSCQLLVQDNSFRQFKQLLVLKNISVRQPADHSISWQSTTCALKILLLTYLLVGSEDSTDFNRNQTSSRDCHNKSNIISYYDILFCHMTPSKALNHINNHANILQ